MEQTSKQTHHTVGLANRWQGMLVRSGDAAAVGIFLAGMLIVGTFLDYPISCELYQPDNGFGLIMAAYGQLPSSAGAVLAGTLFLIGRSRHNRTARVWQTVIGLVMIGVGVYMLCDNPVEYMDMNLVLSCIIALVITVLMMALAVFVSQNARKKDVLLVATVFLFTIVLQMALINLIKIPWGRPRMRLIEADARVSFMPWYEPGTALKDSLVAAGVEAEEFKSFPSGHTGHAVILMLYGLLPWLRHGAGRTMCSERGDQPLSSMPSIRLFVWIGFGWAVLVALSRIIMGAHFLSDTVAGFAVSFLCVLLVPALVFRKDNFCE